MQKKLGILCLSIWLILYGLMLVAKLSFEGSGFILGALAIAAGILLILDR